MLNYCIHNIRLFVRSTRNDYNKYLSKGYSIRLSIIYNESISLGDSITDKSVHGSMVVSAAAKPVRSCSLDDVACESIQTVKTNI